MYIKIVINKQNFLIFQMKKKPTIYQTPTHGLHRFPLQCTHPPTGEEREPPTSQTIVLAIKKTIQGSHPERHLRRNMESTGILKNPQSPRVASLLMSDPSLKCFFFFLVIPAVAKETRHKNFVNFWRHNTICSNPSWNMYTV